MRSVTIMRPPQAEQTHGSHGGRGASGGRSLVGGDGQGEQFAAAFEIGGALGLCGSSANAKYQRLYYPLQHCQEWG